MTRPPGFTRRPRAVGNGFQIGNAVERPHAGIDAVERSFAIGLDKFAQVLRRFVDGLDHACQIVGGAALGQFRAQSGDHSLGRVGGYNVDTAPCKLDGLDARARTYLKHAVARLESLQERGEAAAARPPCHGLCSSSLSKRGAARLKASSDVTAWRGRALTAFEKVVFNWICRA